MFLEHFTTQFASWNGSAVPAAPDPVEEPPVEDEEIEEVGGGPELPPPAAAATATTPKRSRSSSVPDDPEEGQPPKPKKSAKSPKAKAKPQPEDASEAPATPVSGSGLDKIISSDLIHKSTMGEPQKVYFEELVFDEERKFGQVRRLRESMWKEYYEELLAAKVPPKVPFAQALGWKQDGMPPLAAHK